MKKLEDFQAEQIDVKSITGGIGGPAQVSGPRYGTEIQKPHPSDKDCYISQTDWFCDDNGNGRWDSYPAAGSEPGATSNPTIICCE